HRRGEASRCRLRAHDRRDVNAEEQWQRMRGHVVWPLRRTAGILEQIRVVLSLEQRFAVRTEWLFREHDVAAGRICRSIDRDRRSRLTELNLAVLERPDEAMQSLCIRLCLRDDEG